MHPFPAAKRPCSRVNGLEGRAGANCMTQVRGERVSLQTHSHTYFSHSLHTCIYISTYMRTYTNTKISHIQTHSSLQPRLERPTDTTDGGWKKEASFNCFLDSLDSLNGSLKLRTRRGKIIARWCRYESGGKNTFKEWIAMRIFKTDIFIIKE